MMQSFLDWLLPLFDYGKSLLPGLYISLILTATALFCAFCLAILCTIALILKIPIISLSIKVYLTLFVGTPALVQLYLIYYGPAQFPGLALTLPGVWALFSNIWFCAILALTLTVPLILPSFFMVRLKPYLKVKNKRVKLLE